MANYSFFPQVRSDRAVISLHGNEALVFLQNLLTCDVGNLDAGDARYGALLSPQGKIQHDFFVYNDGAGILLDCAREQRAGLIQKLTLYRLRAKLDITVRDDLEIIVGEDGYVDPRDPTMGRRMFAVAGRFAEGKGYDATRISAGLADSVLDIGSNILFPHEANLDQWQGISFSKGCYVGQEVVSRMEHRGTARSRILPIVCNPDAPSKGTQILSGQKSIGEVLSSSGDLALALIRLDRLAEVVAPLVAGTSGVTVKRPDWAKYEVVQHASS